MTSKTGFKPREPRQKVLVPARMRSESGHVDIRIKDISSRGMMVEAPYAPERGEYVEILRPGCSVVGRVVWAREGRFGLLSQDRINLHAVLDRRRSARLEASTPPLLQIDARPPRRSTQPDMSRHVGRVLQYGFIAALAAAAAVGAAGIVYRDLSRAFDSVSRELG